MKGHSIPLHLQSTSVLSSKLQAAMSSLRRAWVRGANSVLKPLCLVKERRICQVALGPLNMNRIIKDIRFCWGVERWLCYTSIPGEPGMLEVYPGCWQLEVMQAILALPKLDVVHDFFEFNTAVHSQHLFPNCFLFFLILLIYGSFPFFSSTVHATTFDDEKRPAVRLGYGSQWTVGETAAWRWQLNLTTKSYNRLIIYYVKNCIKRCFFFFFLNIDLNLSGFHSFGRLFSRWLYKHDLYFLSFFFFFREIHHFGSCWRLGCSYATSGSSFFQQGGDFAQLGRKKGLPPRHLFSSKPAVNSFEP